MQPQILRFVSVELVMTEILVIPYYVLLLCQQVNVEAKK